jgi:3-dehydroquinate synthase
MQNKPIVSHAKALTLLEDLPSRYSKIFILADSNTYRECLPILLDFCPFLRSAKLIKVQAGENSKSFAAVEQIAGEMLAAGADRKSLLLNLGGGMITDLGGFVAATYMRGIDFVQLPTTLLAQVDASLGGKTGINLRGMKNIIGVFAEPIMVLAITIFLRTLPPRERISGLAEMIKHAIIAGGQHWADVRQIGSSAMPDEDLIRDSIAVKAKIVAEDPREKGLRKVLNLGHTVGHAVESLSMQTDEYPLLHGEAVAIGIHYEARLAHRLGYLSADDCKAIIDFLARFYRIPTYSSETVTKLLHFMQHDKKNEADKISFALPFAIGDVRHNIFVASDTIKSIFHD